MLNSAKKKAVAAATVRLTRLGGQGVLVPGGMVLTAAHCIAWSSKGEMVLGDHFVETVATKRKRLKAAPLAVEAVADIAVLGALDDQVFPRECKSWDAWCEATEPIPLCLAEADVFQPFAAFVLAHTGTWVECQAQKCNPIANSFWVNAKEQILGGTSGGPVIAEDGSLLGVVSNFSETGGACDGMVYRPHLTIPPWLFRQMS